MFSVRARLCGLAALVVLACSPALLGTWVYDDWVTATHQAQDGWDDLASVFARDSSQYMVSSTKSPVGVTYRPLSMASLIMVQALHPELPWLHHLVSLLLHLACTWGLYAACRRWRADGDESMALLVAALFALHPVTIEAYGWINGRSDVLAGALLVALACALQSSGSLARRAALCALSAGAAALAKEPAVVVAATLGAAALLPTRGLPGREQLRAQLGPVAGAALGVAVALLARACVTRGNVSGAAGLLQDRELLATFAHVTALALEHTLVPLPRAMLCLSYELLQRSATLDIVLLAACVAALLVLAWRRRFRSVLLLTGALLTLLPVVPVRHLVWLGFDRYLYLPLLLVALSCAELLSNPVSAAQTPRSRPIFQMGVTVALLGLTASSFWSARPYRDQATWLASLVSSRPDDPTGYIMAGAWFLQHDDHARALQAVSRAPREVLSPPLAHDLTQQLVRLGKAEEAAALAERTLRDYPDSAMARFDAMAALGATGRLPEALALARSLASDPFFCPLTRNWAEGWLTQAQLPPPLRAAVRELLPKLACPTTPAP